jgi:hypothetical protein
LPAEDPRVAKAALADPENDAAVAFQPLRRLDFESLRDARAALQFGRT